MIMSEFRLNDYQKVDLSFYKGFQFYRNGYKKDIVIHLIQTIGLIIFLPIDINVMETGHLMVPAISVAIGLSTICIVILIIEYCMIFAKYGLPGYLQMAQNTLHMTS